VQQDAERAGARVCALREIKLVNRQETDATHHDQHHDRQQHAG
jgi:hypothetical protein